MILSLLRKCQVCFNFNIYLHWLGPGPEVIKKISCSTQLSKKFFLLMNVNCWHFNIYDQEK